MRRRIGSAALRGVVCLALALLPGCKCNSEQAPAPQTTPVTPPEPARPAPSASGAPSPSDAPQVHALVGASIAVTSASDGLLVADEDRSQLHALPLPLSADAPKPVTLPGPPAQLATDGDQVWVTVRKPSMLWVGKRVAQAAGAVDVQELARIPLPGDAWGLAVSTDRKRALITSAWTAHVSLVDLDRRNVLWTKEVAREPRGVAFSDDGQSAFVTHLVGAELTRIVLTEPPQLEPIALPAAPLRSPGRALTASLGYAGVFAPDQRRFFAARHALGALGKNSWFGAMTIDVLDVARLESLAPGRPRVRLEVRSELANQLLSGQDIITAGNALTPVVQPRAMVFRRTTRSLLVAGEGDDRIGEFDALALDPTLAVLAQYQVGADYHPNVHVAKHCAAPSGLALSADEQQLWVYCRATNDVALVELNSYQATVATNARHAPDAGAAPNPARSSPSAPKGTPLLTRSDEFERVADHVLARLSLDEDPLGPGGATGRKLFYNATDHVVSGGLACAGCHPEGRDDGHTWHEAQFTTEDGDSTNFTGGAENIPPEAHTSGVARRTPMLAGRVHAGGPYGWHAESPTLMNRERLGFGLHRWGAPSEASPEQVEMRARALSDFLRRGLVAPAHPSAPLTPQQQRGRELFLSQPLRCVECHDPAKSYTTRRAFPLPPLPPPEGFEADPNPAFKIPTLTYLKNRAPYFHDGSAANLTQLIEENGVRMGDTSHLSQPDQAALVAFLETL